jgi:transketolase
VEDANDLAALNAAFDSFAQTRDRPTIIIVRSVIAYGAPNKANTAAAHGAPLGQEEVRLAKRAYGWPEDQFFHVPAEVTAHFAERIGARGRQLREAWRAEFDRYEAAHPDLARELKTMWAGQLPEGWDQGIPFFEPDAKGLASRVSSGKVLNALAPRLPWLVGGSADLAPSNMTMLTYDQVGHFSAAERGGRNLHFGVREHAMAAIANGLSLAKLRPYVGTFFVFSDYLRPALRLSAIMRRPVIYVFTHDSIGLGEDGTTHQPAEQLAACRAIPGLLVIRPADANEVAEAYRTILPMQDRPVALVLTRQSVPTLDRTRYASARGAARGAYVLADPPDGLPEVILIGAGSETSICLAAYEQLTAEGVLTRVVSMPCWELFDEQDQAYRDSVLPPQVRVRVAVEAGVRQGWDKYLGGEGRFLGLPGFGASAPYEVLYQHFGLTPQRVAEEAKAALKL